MAEHRLAGRELVQLLKHEVARRGSQRAVARGLGLTEGRFGRVLSGDHSLSVLSCLRFSQFSGEPPSRVLRAAGKDAIVDLIETLYAVGEDVVSPSEREVLARFRRLSSKAQQAVRELLDELPEAPRVTKEPRLRTPEGRRRREL